MSRWAPSVCAYRGECQLRLVRHAIKTFFDVRFPLNTRQPYPKKRGFTENIADVDALEDEPAGVRMIDGDAEMATASEHETIPEPEDDGTEYFPTSGSDDGNRAVDSLIFSD